MPISSIISKSERASFRRRKARARLIAWLVENRPGLIMPYLMKLGDALLYDNDQEYGRAMEIFRFLGFSVSFMDPSEFEWELRYTHPKILWLTKTAEGDEFVGGACTVLIYA